MKPVVKPVAVSVSREVFERGHETGAAERHGQRADDRMIGQRRERPVFVVFNQAYHQADLFRAIGTGLAVRERTKFARKPLVEPG